MLVTDIKDEKSLISSGNVKVGVGISDALKKTNIVQALKVTEFKRNFRTFSMVLA